MPVSPSLAGSHVSFILAAVFWDQACAAAPDTSGWWWAVSYKHMFLFVYISCPQCMWHHAGSSLAMLATACAVMQAQLKASVAPVSPAAPAAKPNRRPSGPNAQQAFDQFGVSCLPWPQAQPVQQLSMWCASHSLSIVSSQMFRCVLM